MRIYFRKFSTGWKPVLVTRRGTMETHSVGWNLIRSYRRDH
jgi:hypothetical protein